MVTNDFEHFFQCFLARRDSSSVNSLFGFILHFLFGLVCLFVWFLLFFFFIGSEFKFSNMVVMARDYIQKSSRFMWYDWYDTLLILLARIYTLNPSGWNTNIPLVDTFDPKKWSLIGENKKYRIRERFGRMGERQDMPNSHKNRQERKATYEQHREWWGGSSVHISAVQWDRVEFSWVKAVPLSSVPFSSCSRSSQLSSGPGNFAKQNNSIRSWG